MTGDTRDAADDDNDDEEPVASRFLLAVLPRPLPLPILAIGALLPLLLLTDDNDDDDDVTPVPLRLVALIRIAADVVGEIIMMNGAAMGTAERDARAIDPWHYDPNERLIGDVAKMGTGTVIELTITRRCNDW